MNDQANVTPFSPTKRGGRRPRTNARSSNRLWIRITDEERADLEQVARENSCTVTAVMRDAVNTYVADYGERPVFERLSKTNQPPKRMKRSTGDAA